MVYDAASTVRGMRNGRWVLRSAEKFTIISRLCIAFNRASAALPSNEAHARVAPMGGLNAGSAGFVSSNVGGVVLVVSSLYGNVDRCRYEALFAIALQRMLCWLKIICCEFCRLWNSLRPS